MSTPLLQPQNFTAINEVSEQNKELWIKLFDSGHMVIPVGQLHAGELDYLIVTNAKPKNIPPEILSAMEEDSELIKQGVVVQQ